MFIEKIAKTNRKKINVWSLSSTGKTTLVRIFSDLNPKIQIVDLDPKGHLRLEEQYFKRGVLPRGYLDVWGEIIVYDHPTFIDDANRKILGESSQIIVPLFATPHCLFNFSKVYVELEKLRLLNRTLVVFNAVAEDVKNSDLNDLFVSFRSIYPDVKLLDETIPFSAEIGFVGWNKLSLERADHFKKIFGSVIDI